jgi:hypothetical protein
MLISADFCHGHALIFTIVAFSLFYVYGVLHFYRDPGSVFFDPKRELEQHYSLRREIQSIAFKNAAYLRLKTQRANSTDPIWKTGPNATICGIFMTVKREIGKNKNPIEVCIFLYILRFC